MKTAICRRFSLALLVGTLLAGGARTSFGAAPGTVVAWGNDLDVPAAAHSGVTAIAGGGYHSLALKSDGTVVAWGSNDYGQTTVPAGLSGVTAIAGGGYHSLALKSDGTVVAWGSNSVGETNVPAGLNGVTAIAAGTVHSLALKSDGTVVAWGRNCCAVPAGLSGVAAIAAGDSHSLALKSDGTVVAWGENLYGQTNVPAGLSGVTAIAGGAAHGLALKSDGRVIAWGYNFFGQTAVPAGLSGVTAIAGGGLHSLALVPSAPQFTFSGFFAPVSNSETNVVKAGSGVPVKFSLGGDWGLSIIASGYPLSQQISCPLSNGTSDITATVTAGSSSLSYDVVTQIYTYVWKTDKAWANTCRRLVIQFSALDNTMRTANFAFTH